MDVSQTEAAKPTEIAKFSLHQLAGILSPRAYSRAVQLSETDLCPRSWRQFADRFLLGLGVASLLAAVLMLVAYNWSSMGRFLKLGLLQSAVVLTTATAWRAGWQTFGGRLALCAAAVLVGPLLALLGQIYQGAASDYRLFLLWALLVLPWAFVARWAPIWLLVGVLLDVAAWRFWETLYVPGWRSAVMGSGEYYLIAAGASLALINVVGWLLTRPRAATDAEEQHPAWLWHTFAICALASITFAELVYLLWAPLASITMLVALSVVLLLVAAHRQRRGGSPLIAAGLLLTCITLTTALIPRCLDNALPEWLEMITIGLALALQGGIAATWLRRGGTANA